MTACARYILSLNCEIIRDDQKIGTLSHKVERSSIESLVVGVSNHGASGRTVPRGTSPRTSRAFAENPLIVLNRSKLTKQYKK
jgi:hypothetical protein